MTAVPLLLAACLGLAQAQEDVEGAAAQNQSQTELVRTMQETLRQEPGVADSLAARILDSSLGERISTQDDAQARLADIRKWINDNPESAAQVAIGLARDDQEGNHRFEEAVSRNTNRSFKINAENVGKSTYGRLKRSGLDSKLMGADEEMSEEEKREILKGMFEGKGGMSNQVINQAADGERHAPGAPGAPGAVGTTGFSGGYYDRLSQMNLRGYSPQLMALQSALNQRRVPGAPRLMETGKLDYETLSYPAYGMRYDLRNLETRMRYQRNFELARSLGLQGKYKPEQLLDPAVEAELQKKAAGAKLDARFARRLAALGRAAAAIRDFQAAAEAAKDPKNINRNLLVALGGKQKEAARWITVASLEEELQRLESEIGFLSPEMRSLVNGCPVPEATRSAYLRRGEVFERSLLKMKANAEDSVRKLETDGWEAAVAEVESALAENAALRKNLSRNIGDFVKTPYRLRSLSQGQPRWRQYLESAVERYLPGTRWGRELRERKVQRETLKDVFGKIATGDLEAAHTILTACEPAAPSAKK